jgi:hypothetical protein
MYKYACTNKEPNEKKDFYQKTKVQKLGNPKNEKLKNLITI